MTLRALAPALALLALATATTARAQQQACVAPADLGDAVLYAMPIAYDAASTRCVGKFTADGFVARNGSRFIDTFRARQDQAWPGALRLLKTYMAQSTPATGGAQPDMTAMIAALPEESLRPFVDGLVGQMIAEQIKPDSCGKIERGLELLAPLPVDNVAGLFAFVAELADLRNPAICATTPRPSAK